MKIEAVREKRIQQLDRLIRRCYDRAVFVAGYQRLLFQRMMRTLSVPRVRFNEVLFSGLFP